MSGSTSEDEGSGYVVASETCALNVAGAKFVREIEPGEILFINDDGLESVHFKEAVAGTRRPSRAVHFRVHLSGAPRLAVDGTKRPSRAPSHGRTAGASRRRSKPMSSLACPIRAFRPPSATPTGQGIPYQEGLIKNRYIARTFIQPDQTQRELGVRMKLTPLEDVLEGKRVVVVEDSIVRGTTTKRIVQMIRDAGATEVHLRISSPPYQVAVFLRH